ncbi:MAG: HDIG domain-containing protein [Pirellulaceae bacterium]
MSSGLPKRSRSTLQLPPGHFARSLVFLRRNDVLLRLGLCAAAAVAMWLITSAWRPAFPFRLGHTPPRDISARVEFSVPDARATENARQRARADVICLYQHDPQPLDELQRALTDKVFQLLTPASFDAVDKALWQEFVGREEDGAAPDEDRQRADYERFRGALSEDEDLKRFKRSLMLAFSDFRENGLLESLQHELNEGNQTEIRVFPKGNPDAAHTVRVSQVRIGEAAGTLHRRLVEELEDAKTPGAEQVAGHLFNWLRPKLSHATTLKIDSKLTQLAADEAAERVEPVERKFLVGEKIEGVKGGQALSGEQLSLLGTEHAAYVASFTPWQILLFTAADLGMYVALFVLCGSYIYYHDRRLIRDLRKLLTLLGSAVATIAIVRLAPRDMGRLELIPMLLFAMAATIAYQRELALLLSACLSLIAVLALGAGLPELVILLASMASAIYLIGRIRSRTKLIYVGLGAGVTAFFTTLGVSTLAGQPLGLALLINAGWFAFSAVLAGLVMTGLLPFIERLFDVQTDLSLLELGDAAHPLLQELVRRAPGTYNHSINVASIGEAAAEAIGANGLLVRVGAYFHDIGKMLKPGYFIENQQQGVNRHESLLPAMSTLVIIAHVKDGADLARKHRLPQSVIDFIEQHHGTTLVEYFFNRATRQSEEDPDGGSVDESSFRYPGPKPQTREAGVMMLADAVESASRTLVDPTPARIENLVEEIAMKRLLDGQFDECSLTLKEINTVVESLAKSLTAVYHGRVKYPERQQTA